MSSTLDEMPIQIRVVVSGNVERLGDMWVADVCDLAGLLKLAGTIKKPITFDPSYYPYYIVKITRHLADGTVKTWKIPEPDVAKNARFRFEDGDEVKVERMWY